MLKKISAALLVASMIAAPAMAATNNKSVTAPGTKSASATKSAPMIKPATQVTDKAKPSTLNANARGGRHHHRHISHHRFHVSKLSVKQPAPVFKRS